MLSSSPLLSSVCVCVCMYVCMYVCVYLSVCFCVCVCVCVCVKEREGNSVYVCLYVGEREVTKGDIVHVCGREREKEIVCMRDIRERGGSVCVCVCVCVREGGCFLHASSFSV